MIPTLRPLGSPQGGPGFPSGWTPTRSAGAADDEDTGESASEAGWERAGPPTRSGGLYAHPLLNTGTEPLRAELGLSEGGGDPYSAEFPASVTEQIRNRHRPTPGSQE